MNTSKSFLLCILSFLFSFINIECQQQNGLNNASFLNKSSDTYELVICAVFQNEALFLKEWIEFHKLMGVQHFYLYNNLSTDNYAEILHPYIEAGEVELWDWPVEVCNQKEYLDNLQLPTYNHALALIKDKTKWAAFIDLDEFLYPVRHGNLIELLHEYEAYAGLAVNWQMYGTSWLNDLPPQGLITEHLILKAPEHYELNKIVKLIVQPTLVESIPNPHFFKYKEGFFAVNSLKQPLQPHVIRHPIVIDTIRINHYWFGPYSWFINNKIPRRKKWGVEISEPLLKEFIASYNQVKDESVARFIPRLKQAMNQ